MSRREILRHSLTLVIVTFMSRIMGLIREVVRAAYLGTTVWSDAFAIGFLVPNLLRKLFAEGSIAVAFVPTFKGYLINENREKIKEFLSATFTMISFLVTATVLAGMAASGLIIKVFFSDLPANVQEETALLTRLMFPYLAFISIAAFFQGCLNSVNHYSASGFVPVLFNGMVVLATLFLSPYMANPARAMAVGVIIGGFLQATVQLPFVIKKGLHFTVVPIKKAFSDPGTRKVLMLVAPTVIGMAAYELNVLVSSVIASSAGEGVVSSLQFSNRLLELLLGIFAVSLGTVVLTELSENAKRGDWGKFSSNMLFSFNLTTLITIPAAIFAILNAREIISLLFKIRTFNEDSVRLTATAFVFHISGLWAIALNRVMAPAFYAQEDTKSPTWAGMISFGANILFCLLLVGPMHVGGIALAATLAALVNTIALFAFLTRRQKGAFMPLILGSIGYASRTLFIAAAAALPIYFFKDSLYGVFAHSSLRLIHTALPLTLGAAAYFLFLFTALALMKDEHATYIYGKIHRRLPWNK